jgi:predicted 3-demethylubiquinone-9 3-methyltransferase (glyoxalase superfamily)
MQDVSTFLWFDTEAEEAARFYTSLFEDGRITYLDHYGSAGPRPEGLVRTVRFELAGRCFIALNGGPDYSFTEAVSLLVHCDGQDEVDRLWETLTEGGEPGPCGWLKDRYGLSWQIVPSLFFELIGDPDPVRSEAAMAAMLTLGKLECAALRAAVDNA